MGFLGVYRAIYDYAAQAEGELAISEGDMLFILEKSTDDDWWKAKKKAAADDDDEPIGLIPNNYVEDAKPIAQARTLYEYTRQTEEELSFHEDATLEVYDTTDPDWILVGLQDDYGFVPANYVIIKSIEQTGNDINQNNSVSSEQYTLVPPTLPSRSTVERDAAEPSCASEAIPLAGSTTSRAAPKSSVSYANELEAHSPPALPPRDRISPETPKHDVGPVSPHLPTQPALQLEPRQPHSHQTKLPPKPIHSARHNYDTTNASPLSPGGFRLYHINEMVSVMGKRKKMPTTLGINLATGIIMIAPENAQEGPTHEWNGNCMTHYSREGKHVFLELVKPSKSIDFHAGAKDTAEEIISALGELAAAIKAEGLHEVIAATKSKSQKKGLVLYEFAAQGEDEVSVKADDEVIVLDDKLSEEWWKVKRVCNGREGVVPSSYIKIFGILSEPLFTVQPNLSTVEQNRLDEKRLTKEALKHDSRSFERNSSHENGRSIAPVSSRSRPDPSKVRTWTDRSKSFSVEAQFLGLKDGKVHLHKMNGVKIAVPAAKMSMEDLEFLESTTGISVVSKLSSSQKHATMKSPTESRRIVGASVEHQKPEYDWFQFFLSCDVAVALCDRYAQAFVKDSMDESVLPDVDATVLRNLGFREGDIIKVMRFLDSKYGRSKSKRDREAGLFSGPGGALKNNTHKSRPLPASQTTNIIVSKPFSPDKENEILNQDNSAVAANQPVLGSLASGDKAADSFEDSAWDIKPAKTTNSNVSEQSQRHAESAPNTSSSQDIQPKSAPNSNTQDISPMIQPIESMKSGRSQSTPSAESKVAVPQPTGSPRPVASPLLFDAVASLTAGPPTIQAQSRPVPTTSGTPNPGGLIPPPSPRPLSAPHAAGLAQFNTTAMLAQTTGIQGQVAPHGQSLQEITQARHQQMQTQPIMVIPNSTSIMGPQMTGVATQFSNQSQEDPFRSRSRYIIPDSATSQPTGISSPYSVTGSINSFLPSPLEPQRAPMQMPIHFSMANSAGLAPFTGSSNQQQTSIQPIAAQKTGPAPQVRFGISTEPTKMTPSSTGRKANLAQATPENPFGF